MDPKVRTYDPKKIIVDFGGIIFTGYMSGTFLAIAGNGNSFDKERGADGGIDRVNKNANDYSVTITLKRTSLTNDALSERWLSDVKNNDGVKSLLIKDLNGTTLFNPDQAWIAKAPDPDESDSMPSRAWMLETGAADLFIGGTVV